MICFPQFQVDDVRNSSLIHQYFIPIKEGHQLCQTWLALRKPCKPCRLSQITLLSMCLSIVFRRIFWRYQILVFKNFQFPLVNGQSFFFCRMSKERWCWVPAPRWISLKKKILKGLLYAFPSVTYVYGVCISIYLTERILLINICAESLSLIIHYSSI